MLRGTLDPRMAEPGRSRWRSVIQIGIAGDAPTRGGYNSDDITKVGVGGGGLLSQEAVMTE